MKILLDECIDRRLGREFVGHDVRTVPQVGWAGIKNGELLRLAQSEYAAFVTTDQNLEIEQNLRSFSIAILVMHAKTSRVSDLRPLIPELLAKLNMCKPGTVTHIARD